jgi:hypothetical protein
MTAVGQPRPAAAPAAAAVTFTVRLQARPGTDPVRRLRAALKTDRTKWQ